MLARFLVGRAGGPRTGEAGARGNAKQQKLRSLSAGFLSPFSLSSSSSRLLCASLVRGEETHIHLPLFSLSSRIPLPTPPGPWKREIFWCKIRSAAAASALLRAQRFAPFLAGLARWWFLGWRLARAGSWSSCFIRLRLQRRATVCSDQVDDAARRVIPWPLLVAGGRCPRLIRFFGRLWLMCWVSSELSSPIRHIDEELFPL